MATRALDDRLTQAIDAWRLSARMVETLLLVVTGLSNKEIAVYRDRAEVTIEYHITTLMRRAQVDTRSRLVGKFWLGLEEQG
jgi:DNA-binding NarL/FixJ family response regulator